MKSASVKAKGRSWANAIVGLLAETYWPHAERRALRGARDAGDIAGIVGVVIEAKNAQRIELGPWLDEAQAEAVHADAEFGVVWIKRRGHPAAGAGFVVMDGDDFVALIHAAGY